MDETPKRFDRIVAILIQLQSKKIVKAQELADRFECSLRTIYRDIRTLEASGVPIYSEAGVGYALMDGYRLPPVMFTREEVSSFIAAEKLMQKFTDPSLGTHYASAMYKLKAVLQRYRTIEKNGGWETIVAPADFKQLKPGDSSDLVVQIRKRLFLTNDIAVDSKRAVYDESLQEAILKYKKRNGFSEDKIILPKHISEMNVSISDRIKTIMVNMELCRWLSTDLTKAKAFIVVNIPSYRLTFFKDGKAALVSNVVVGTALNETVIFSGMMSYVVFSPYWNVPKSIRDKEILPAIKKNKDYLAKHNMEWNGNNIRQKPGPNNSLGLVKFLFPNSNNIYLHDTPAKNLFSQEKRAFSHGCIRVQKPKELAQLILQDDPNWNPEKIDAAMNSGKEKWYTLKNKIPVYIGYFTAWVDDDGLVNFHKDIYDRDNALANLLLEE